MRSSVTTSISVISGKPPMPTIHGNPAYGGIKNLERDSMDGTTIHDPRTSHRVDFEPSSRVLFGQVPNRGFRCRNGYSLGLRQVHHEAARAVPLIGRRISDHKAGGGRAPSHHPMVRRRIRRQAGGVCGEQRPQGRVRKARRRPAGGLPGHQAQEHIHDGIRDRSVLGIPYLRRRERGFFQLRIEADISQRISRSDYRPRFRRICRHPLLLIDLVEIGQLRHGALPPPGRHGDGFQRVSVIGFPELRSYPSLAEGQEGPGDDILPSGGEGIHPQMGIRPMDPGSDGEDREDACPYLLPQPPGIMHAASYPPFRIRGRNGLPDAVVGGAVHQDPSARVHTGSGAAHNHQTGRQGVHPPPGRDDGLRRVQGAHQADTPCDGDRIQSHQALHHLLRRRGAVRASRGEGAVFHP